MGKCIVVAKLTAEAEEVNLERRGRKAGRQFVKERGRGGGGSLIMGDTQTKENHGKTAKLQ